MCVQVLCFKDAFIFVHHSHACAATLPVPSPPSASPGIHRAPPPALNTTYSFVTDAAFAHLRGIHRLNMSLCSQVSITGASFAHLAGIHRLRMVGCSKACVAGARALGLFVVDRGTMTAFGRHSTKPYNNSQPQGPTSVTLRLLSVI